MAQLDTGTDTEKIIRAHIRVIGIIQGVGFRPFIYRLAKALPLTGYVVNTAAGVTIEAEGTESDLESFIHSITEEKPSLAVIDDLQIEKSAVDPA
ncbi:acylphosphatase, partial [Thermodesulfobacteriota bacterium]